MALMVVTGLPCSGKTTYSNILKQYIESKIQEAADSSKEISGKMAQLSSVVLINDQSLKLSRYVYGDIAMEKAARSALQGAVIRNVGPKTIVIVDCMNYIKGLRYQFWCAAREAAVPICTIWVITQADTCKSWNEVRPQEDAYPDQIIRELFMRYEEPNPSARWDAPLISYAPLDDTAPTEKVWSTLLNNKVSAQTTATRAPAIASANYLQILEQVTQASVKAILVCIADSSFCVGDTITYEPDVADIADSRPKCQLRMPLRSVTMPELYRLRRKFTAMNKQAPLGGVLADRIVKSFSEFLQSHLETE